MPGVTHLTLEHLQSDPRLAYNWPLGSYYLVVFSGRTWANREQVLHCYFGNADMLSTWYANVTEGTLQVPGFKLHSLWGLIHGQPVELDDVEPHLKTLSEVKSTVTHNTGLDPDLDPDVAVMGFLAPPRSRPVDYLRRIK